MKLLSIFKKILQEEVKEIESESDMEKIMSGSPKVTGILTDLLTSKQGSSDAAKEELRQVVTDIKIISMKPTTFRIVMKNGSFFDLKYNPSPLQLRFPDQFKPIDAFTVLISGKKYDIGTESEYQQALDYINNLLKTQPAGQGNTPPEEEAPPGDEETPQEDQSDDQEEDQ